MESKSKTKPTDGRVTLELTQWELENLHLPPVTTLTFYPGSAPIESLRRRMALLLEKNPWLSARIVKKGTAKGVVAMDYAELDDLELFVDQHLSVYEPGQIGLTSDLTYEQLVRCVSPLQCARSKPATDADEPLFKVAVVPIEAATAGKREAPLQSAMTLPGFALVVSMNHTLGDGHTYYKLYGMLDGDAEVESLDPVRVPDFEEAKAQVIGEKGNALFTSAGLGLGIVLTYLATKLPGRAPQNVCVHSIDPSWIEREKARALREAQVPFISSNDALTSWFLREMHSDLNIMVVNLREREPSVLGLSDRHVGNYEANVPYFPGDLEIPSLIRQSILDPDGTFRARRAGFPTTEIPGFLTLLRNRSSIITNWASFYRDVRLRDQASSGESRVLEPRLHLPILEPDGLITSVWNSAVVFRPREGDLGLLMITRRFDHESVAERKNVQGSAFPLGVRLI